MKEDIPGFYFGIPTRDCWVHACHIGLTQPQQDFKARIEISSKACSLLALSFNQLLCAALNKRKDGITHFGLIHADVVPLGPWLKTLYGEMTRFNLDCISAIITTRSDSGHVSTAIDQGATTKMGFLGDFTGTVTSREYKADKDGRGGLLINTGCLIMDITKPWMDDFPGFCVTDNIVKRENGEWEACCESEDWAMSRWFTQNGVPFGCTDKVKILHYGTKHFPNWKDAPQQTGTDEIDMTKENTA